MEPVLDVDRVEVGYPDALSLMRDLKAIGAHNVTAGRPRALVGRARLKRMQDAYEAFAAMIDCRPPTKSSTARAGERPGGAPRRRSG